LWTPGSGLSCDTCLNPVATPPQTTLYKITAVTKNGCEDSGIILLLVNKNVSIYVPNAFSPNNDGVNDVIMIFADPNKVANIKSFLVFSRWGETVYEYYNFQPNDPAYGWDGSHRGEMMNPAVFAWFAEVEFVDGRVELFEGDVTLVR
jgi:gliding motility-associated-like protein